MRVLGVVHAYPPYRVTGVERVAEATAQGLVAAGDEVSVFTRRAAPVPPTFRLEVESRGGVTVRTLTGGGDALDDYPRGDADLARAFERVLAETAPDVVLVSHLMYHSPLYVPIAHRYGVPVVFELHDFHAMCPLAHLRRTTGELCAGPEGGHACATVCFAGQPRAPERWALRYAAFRGAVEMADRLVCPSHYVANRVAEVQGDLAKIEVVPNGIFFDPPTVPPETRRPLRSIRLVTIGGVAQHKGADLVIEAVRLTDLQEVRYELLGPVDPPTAAGFEERARHVPHLKLRLEGPFTASELPALLHGADAVVIASLVPESFSLAAREAFACGVPVLAARTGALPEVVDHGVNGFLFEPGDVAELAGLISRMAADDQVVARLRAGARATPVMSAAQRTERMRAILAEVVAEGVPVPSAMSPSANEIVALRDGLLERT